MWNGQLVGQRRKENDILQSLEEEKEDKILQWCFKCDKSRHEQLEVVALFICPPRERYFCGGN